MFNPLLKRRLFQSFSFIPRKTRPGQSQEMYLKVRSELNSGSKIKKKSYSSDRTRAETIFKISNLFKPVGPENPAVKFTFPYPKSCSKACPSPNSCQRLSDMCASDMKVVKSIILWFLQQNKSR